VILVRPFTEADDVAGFHAAKGILTSRGGKASHAALVARGMGKPCVAGAGELEIDLESKLVRVGDTELGEGDRIAIDGSTGVVTADDVALEDSKVSDEFETVLGWADELRSLGVRANADTAHDAAKAREFGAQGIGLCRSEHIFLGTEHQSVMQAMIMAETDEDRDKELDRLLELQTAHFKDLFDAMRGLPVTIRLLDPPLHEFIPNAEELAQKVERARIEESDELEELQHTLERVHKLAETNPMLGTRGVRLAVLRPEIYEMQVRAIVRAALALDEQPELEVMIPLIAYEQELDLMRKLVENVIEEEDGGELRPLLGTMIELPRACFIADRIAERADFFSFGTNDLTQTALGFSRDDVGGMLARYMEEKIIERSPFETIDAPGVGWLVRLAAWVGREAKPDLKLGICGEHGGDPDSIALFQMAGLDYVSCSPYRVPIARVAAAQSAISASSNP
jgi:pyruvate,orthophosphate dikinase